MVKISIVIPVYNMAQYIPCCLDSLAQQTLKEYEALCVDDGSTDNSLEVVREYAKKDKRVRSIPLGKNMGVFAARNKALECATGEFIAFLDPDDWYPEKDVLEDMYTTAKKHKVLICGGGWTNHYPDKPPQTEFGGTLWGLGCFKNPGVIEYKDYQFDFGYQRFIFDRELLQKNKIVFPSYTRFQDPPFFVRAMHAAGRFYGMNRSTYNYRASYKQVDFSRNNFLKTKDMLRGLIDDLEFSARAGLHRLHVLTYDRCNNCVNCFAEGLRKDPEVFALVCRMNESVNREVLDGNKKFITSGYRPYVRPLQELFSEKNWIEAGVFDMSAIRRIVDYFAEYVVDGDTQSMRDAIFRRIWRSACSGERPRVSILIPAYNVAECIGASLDSALAQGGKDIEIICVDDGSSDSTWKVMEEYAKKDPRLVNLRHKRNCGLYMARKTAVYYCTGRYATLLDSDDRLLPGACDAMVKVAEQQQADIVQGRTRVNNVRNFPASRLAWVEKPTTPYADVMDGGKLLSAVYVQRKFGTNVWAKLYRRNLLLKAYLAIHDARITMAEDVLAMYPILAFSKKYAPCADEVYLYTYGTGITGKSELSDGEFEKQCGALDILMLARYLRDGACSAHPDRWPAYLALKKRVLDETYGRVWAFLQTKESQLKGLRYYERKLGSLEFVKYLAEKYFNDRGEIIQRLDRLGYVPQIRKTKIKRVGFFYFHLTTGGVQRVMLLLAPVFQRLGYEVVFILEKEIGEGDFELPQGVKVRYLPVKSQNTAQTNVAARIDKFAEIIRSEKLDLIYYHAFSSHVMQWDLLTAKLVFGMPFVVHFHSCIGTALYAATQTAEFSYLPAKLRMCDCVVTLSRTDELYLSSQGIRARYLPNPLDGELKKVALCNKPGCLKERRVVWVARIDWGKHPLDPIVAFAEVHRKIPDAKLTMIGGGPEGIVASMKARIEELGLSECIDLVGNQVSAYPYYAGAAAFLMTSSFEGFPMTLIEAGCHGLPVVMYGLPFLEAVRGNAGIVQVDQNDTKGMAAALCDILSDEKRQAEMSRANQDFMRRFGEFDQSAAWKKILDGLQDTSEPLASVVPGAEVPIGEVRLLLEELQYCYANGFKTRMGRIRRLEKDLSEVKVALSGVMAKESDRKAAVESANSGELHRVAKKVTSLVKEVDALKHSESYRLGIFLTWPLRRLRRLFVR